MSTQQLTLDQHLQAMVGREYGPVHAWDEVNPAMIRHWCEATGNRNPAYLDPAWAAASVHGALVAPPTMLQAWLFPGLEGIPAPGSAAQDPSAILDLLGQHGFSTSVGVNSEQQYLRYLRIGDRLHGMSTISAVSPLKQTALGAGYFVTIAIGFFDQHGAKVGSMLFRQLVYRPGPAVAATALPAAAPVPAAPAAQACAAAARPFSSVRMGERLAPMAIPVTVSSIIAGAIATRDYHPVHHDVDAVRQMGMPGIFMNILTTNACVERFVTAWSGPDAVLMAVNIKLGTPNYAGDCMHLTGRVTGLDSSETRAVEVSVEGVNVRGTHVSAVVRLQLP